MFAFSGAKTLLAAQYTFENGFEMRSKHIKYITQAPE